MHTARIDRLTVYRLAALADVDPRTAAKALRDGVEAVKGRPAERIAAVLEKGAHLAPSNHTAA